MRQACSNLPSSMLLSHEDDLQQMEWKHRLVNARFLESLNVDPITWHKDYINKWYEVLPYHLHSEEIPNEKNYRPFEYNGKPLFAGEITMLVYPVESIFAEK